MPALIGLCRDPDPAVRRAAVGALVYDKSGNAVEALIAGLGDEDWQVREEAAGTASKLRPSVMVALSASALSDDFWQVRLKAAHALGTIGDVRAVPALGEALACPVSNLRKEVAAALGEIADPSARGRSLCCSAMTPTPTYESSSAGRSAGATQACLAGCRIVSHDVTLRSSRAANRHSARAGTAPLPPL